MPAPIYHPLTATPWKRCAAYREILPCPPLRSYVRCFWIGQFHEGVSPAPEIVIPDTCVDIIYHMHPTAGILSARFCGINDSSFFAYTDPTASIQAIFGIRFYAWSAYLFSEDSLAGTVNGVCEVRQRFSWLDNALQSRLPEAGSLSEKIRFAEGLLLKRLASSRSNPAVDHAVGRILAHRGAQEVSRLSRESFLSTRQLERLFHEYIGVPPKKLSSLIRYQFLWRDMVTHPDFDPFTAVCRYGYTDLSHLTREFKRYHSMGIHAARLLAARSK